MHSACRSRRNSDRGWSAAPRSRCIRKVNFGTDVCYSFLDKVFETSRDKVAIDMFMKDAVQNVKNFAVNKIKLLGADNKA